MINSKNMLKITGLCPNKALGQNFLIDEASLLKIVELANCAGLPVLEIGPGFGVLTSELAKAASKVLAVEIDKRLFDILSEEFSSNPVVETVCCDFLKYPTENINASFSNMPFVVAANLPYYITSPICSRLMDCSLPIIRMVLMMQDEAADRFIARPGARNYGPLSVISQYLYEVSAPLKLSPSSYYPAPDVNSTVMLFERNQNVCPKNMMRILKAAFAMRRKTLYNNMLGIMSKDIAASAIGKAGLNPSVRAEALAVEDFVRLCEAYNDLIADRSIP